MATGSIERRGKSSWRLSVSAGTDYNGKRITFKKTIRANTKAEAEIELARYIAEIASPNYKLPDNITLNEFVQIWLRDHAERDLQPKTLVGYKSILNRRILPEFGARPMAEIKPIEINRFYTKLLNMKKVPGSRSGGTLSSQTVRHYHMLLSKIFNDAVRLEIVEKNPLQRVFAPKVKQRRIKLEDTSLEDILQALEEEPIQYQVLINLTIGTGMRLGEVAGLEWRHIDFKRHLLQVNQSAQQITGKEIIIKDPKSQTSERNIALPESVLELLTTYKEVQKSYPTILNAPNWVFRNPDGTHMKPNLLSDWFRRFLKRHNLRHMRFHDLRHLSATLSLQNGISPTNVAARLGHAKTSTTMNIYSHALRSVDVEAAANLDRLLRKAKESSSKLEEDIA